MVIFKLILLINVLKKIKIFKMNIDKIKKYIVFLIKYNILILKEVIMCIKL